MLLYVLTDHGVTAAVDSKAIVPASLSDAVVSIIDTYTEHSQQQVNWKSKVVTMPDARVAIVAAAEDWGADYICMGARGINSTVDRASMPVGSSTDYVVRNAPCSVIVVRKKKRNVVQ